MTERLVTFKVDPSLLFDMLHKMQGDTAALGRRLVEVLLAKDTSFATELGLGVYGIELVASPSPTNVIAMGDVVLAPPKTTADIYPTLTTAFPGFEVDNALMSTRHSPPIWEETLRKHFAAIEARLAALKIDPEVDWAGVRLERVRPTDFVDQNTVISRICYTRRGQQVHEDFSIVCYV